MLTLEYLARLLESNREAASARVAEFAIGHQHFAFNSRPALMGVINLSPDSWYRESVCIEAGANVLNLTGTQSNDELFRLVADHDAAVIICYVQGENVREVGDFDFGADAVERMKEYFARQIETASRHKVEKILIDPGLGFYYRNLQDSALRVQHQIK